MFWSFTVNHNNIHGYIHHYVWKIIDSYNHTIDFSTHFIKTTEDGIIWCLYHHLHYHCGEKICVKKIKLIKIDLIWQIYVRCFQCPHLNGRSIICSAFEMFVRLRMKWFLFPHKRLLKKEFRHHKTFTPSPPPNNNAPSQTYKPMQYTSPPNEYVWSANRLGAAGINKLQRI